LQALSYSREDASHTSVFTKCSESGKFPLRFRADATNASVFNKTYEGGKFQLRFWADALYTFVFTDINIKKLRR
jgi:hypothetical protein